MFSDILAILFIHTAYTYNVMLLSTDCQSQHSHVPLNCLFQRAKICFITVVHLTAY